MARRRSGDAWNARSLAEEPIVRLILDGTSVRVRLDRKATSISLFVVSGVRANGQKVLLAIKSMGSESTLGANTGLLHRSMLSFNHHISGFEVDDEPEGRRLLDWDVGGLSNWTHSITSSVRVSPDQEKRHDQGIHRLYHSDSRPVGVQRHRSDRAD